MKSLIVAVGLTFTTYSAICQESKVSDPKALATTEKIDGYYIYVDCTPVAKYEVIGTVNTPKVVKNNKYKTMRATMLKKGKKEQPKADGFIFKNQNVYSCEAIKFMD